MLADTTRQSLVAARNTRPNSGFALIIVLSLMSLAILTLLTISTLISVETSTSTNARQQLQAKNNAILGLQIALGTLQSAAGPDQRITANAGISDAVHSSKVN